MTVAEFADIPEQSDGTYRDRVVAVEPGGNEADRQGRPSQSFWTWGRRWPPGRHRVLPPRPHAPEEDLVSLIYFYEANHDARVVPLAPPVGRVAGLAPVTCSDFIKERLDAITVS